MTEKLDLLLIHPGTNKTVYEGLADDYAAFEPPYLAAIVGGSLRQRGFRIGIIDANAEKLTHQETVLRAKEHDPKMVGIIVHGHQPSASSQLMGAVGDLCREIRGKIDSKIVLAGSHPSSLPERTLREEECDFVARGEEFPVFLGLLEGKNPEGVPGLCFLREGEFRANATAPLISDLDSTLGDVAWDLLPPFEKYRAHNWHSLADIENRSPYASLYTSLGCPYKCSFCMINAPFKANIAGRQDQTTNDERGLLKLLDNTRPTIRFWSPDFVLRQIDYLVDHGVRNIKFIDEMFVFNKRHMLAIAEGIINRGYDLNIWAYARVDTVNDRGVLDILRRAGITWLALGIESASQEVRDGADKKYGNEEIFEAVKRVESVGMNIIGNYMVGLRGDTPESMQSTLDLALELSTDWHNLYATMAYPGAPDYTCAKERGILLPGDRGVPGGWTAYSHHSYFTLPLPTDELSAAEVLRFREGAWTKLFTDQRWIQKIKSKFGSKAVNHVKKMTSRPPLKRRILGD